MCWRLVADTLTPSLLARLVQTAMTSPECQAGTSQPDEHPTTLLT
jgi:hypothetical protein